MRQQSEQKKAKRYGTFLFKRMFSFLILQMLMMKDCGALFINSHSDVTRQIVQKEN